MPNASFEKAPLVEIVAELRWLPSDIAAPTLRPGEQSITLALVPPPSLDVLSHAFIGEIYQHNFRQIERLIPPGIPIALHQPALRFRQEQNSALFQLGLGLFSANALQPYNSWIDFRPIVQQGVAAILKARVESDRCIPFSLHSLRYIDVFGADLLGEQSVAQFLRKTLGFAVSLPDPVSSLIADADNIKSHLQFAAPIKDTNKTLNLSIGEGMLPTAPSSPALIMEITVTEQSVAANEDAIMESFNSSRQIIHDTFVRMTEKIHPLMKPRRTS